VEDEVTEVSQESGRLLAKSESKVKEASYAHVVGTTMMFTSTERFQCQIKESPRGGVLEEFTLAYETWGVLNAKKSNAILLHTGLSGSSHAKSTAVSIDRRVPNPSRSS
jgi:homoserine acetyltransferase